MRICLDARGNHFGGVYTYTYSLLRTLPSADSAFEYLVLLDEHQVNEGRLPVDNIPIRTVSVLSPIKMVWWNNWELPKVLKEEKIDLYHGFKHFGLMYPKNHRCKMIWTLHTASWWVFPELFSMQERFFWTRYYTEGAKRLDHVICVAQADKKTFIEKKGLNSRKVSVTQLAADSRFTRVEDQAVLKQVRQRYTLPERYILYVGTIYPFKNIETIIRVFAKAVKKKGLPHNLVLVGDLSPAYGDNYRKSLTQLAIEKGVDDRMHWIGSVFDELPAVYTMADVLLFPSRYEAFPQPPLEAMACQIPVISSNAAGLPEVVGEAGLMRPPDDVQGLTDDLLNVLRDKRMRTHIIQKGLERAKHFSWERCASDTVKVYHRLLDLPQAAN